MPRPASRYGGQTVSTGTRRRIAIGLGALAAVLGVGVAALLYQRYEGADVEGRSAAFEVLDPQTVRVTIIVTRKDPSTPVVCIVRARSADGAETGRREILVGPSQDRAVQVSTTVKSYRPVAAGDIYGCGTEVPGYLTQG